jgi:phage repressor protein C with HTH and peptisase S24 domain
MKNDSLQKAYEYLRYNGKVKTQTDVARIMEASRSNVSGAFNGDGKYLTSKFLKRFNNAFGNIFNEKWLLTGEGNMLDKITSDFTQSNDSLYYTYLLPMSAIGGSLVGFDTKGAMASDCEKIISPIADVDFAITIYGDSMYPTFPSGSRVLIKKIDPEVFIIWGSTYVLDTVNGIVIKEVHESSEKGKIICHSLNPSGKYSDFEVNMKDIRGWYRVLACISML